MVPCENFIADAAQILANLPGDIPVVRISVPTADILRTIRKCTQLYGQKQIGIIAAGNMLAGITGLSDLCDAPIQTYLLSPNWNNEALVDQAVREGCEVIIGGLNTCRYAQMIHIPNMLIETSKEAFWDALSSAKRALLIFRKEQEKSMRLQTILDISHDGIIFIDPSRRVTTVNKKAQSVFGLDSICIGKRTIDFPFPLELKNILSDNNEYTNKILQHNRTLLSISKTFVRTQAFLSGSIVNIQLVNEIQSLEGDIRKQIYDKGLVAKLTFEDMIGTAPAMASVIRTARKYSQTNSNILLIGESGTGKEVLAQSIHNSSSRSLCPFVAVNCAAIPDTLLESEPFGYVTGAFTGARKNGKAGLFELAHSGTIFLDEIGEIPLPLQAKLLRVLQEREIMRVGGDSVIHVDIRIIAATNQNLESLVQNNQFREDLFYRLDVLRINIPPLNQHREDIPFWFPDTWTGTSPASSRSLKSSSSCVRQTGPATYAIYSISASAWPCYAAAAALTLNVPDWPFLKAIPPWMALARPSLPRPHLAHPPQSRPPLPWPPLSRLPQMPRLPPRRAAKSWRPCPPAASTRGRQLPCWA